MNKLFSTEEDVLTGLLIGAAAFLAFIINDQKISPVTFALFTVAAIPTFFRLKMPTFVMFLLGLLLLCAIPLTRLMDKYYVLHSNCRNESLGLCLASPFLITILYQIVLAIWIWLVAIITAVSKGDKK